MSGDIFNYDSLQDFFSKVLCLRKLDPEINPVFGFVFTETDDDNTKELESIIKSDLKEFI